MPGHKNAPLTPEGRLRLCLRIDAGRPIAHVASEAGVSRKTLGKWYSRWQADGPDGLVDHTSRPGYSPTAISEDLVDAILELRKAEKWGAARIAAHMQQAGVEISPTTVHRTLERHGMSRVRDMDPGTGKQLRIVQHYEHDAPGDMVHVDIKKVGRIPTGGGWWAHGQGSEQHKASKRKGQGTGKIGNVYLHSAVDDHSRLAYTEVLEDEKGETAAAFWLRAAAFFLSHNIVHIERCLTDNGSCYRSRAFAAALAETDTRHKRTRPYRPQTNGKVERFNQTMIREWLRREVYTSEQDRRNALAPFLNYYNHERPHSSLGYKPPVSRAPGPKIDPPSLIEQETVDLTPDQMSIFDLLVTAPIAAPREYPTSGNNVIGVAHLA